jgi:tetratricopeptide (TPR) repeat protein
VQKSAPPTAGADWKDLDQRIEKARAAGNYKEAIALVQKKLSLQRQRLGKVHDDIAESLTSLATLQADADDYAAAQKTCQECLALETQLHGAKHYRTVDASWRLKRAERLSVLSPEQRRRYTQTFVLQDTLATLGNEGKYQEGLTTARKILQWRTELLGLEHPDSATAMIWQAWMHGSLEELAEAERLYRQGADLRERLEGEYHGDTADALNLMAQFYTRVGDGARAEPLYRRVMAIRKQLVGERHASYAQALYYLGLHFETLGNADRAEDLYRQVVRSQNKVPPESRPAIWSTTVGQLIGLLQKRARAREAAGDDAAACAPRQELLTLQAQLHGDKHWLVSDGRWALDRAKRRSKLNAAQKRRLLEAEELTQWAGALDRQGNYKESLVPAERARATVGELMGQEHPDYAACLHLLGWLHYQQEDYAGAERHYRRALTIREKTLGKEHPDYASNLNGLALVFEYQNDYSQAAPLYEEAQAIYARTRGTKQGDYLTLLTNRITLYEKRAQDYEVREDFDAARRLRQQVLKLRRQQYGGKHSQVKDAQWALVRLEHLARLDRAQRRELLATDAAMKKVNELLKQNKFEEGLVLVQEALETRKRLLGTDHLDYAACLSWKGLLHYKREEYSKTEPLWRETVQLYKRVLGEEHPSYTQRLQNLYAVYDGLVRAAEARGDWDAALRAQDGLIALQIERYGATHYRVTNASLDRADIERRAKLTATQRQELTDADQLMRQVGELSNQKNYKEGLKAAQKALGTRKTLLGDEHPRTAMSLAWVAWFYECQNDAAQAEKLYRLALETRRRILGEEHPDYTDGLVDLGRLYDQKLNDSARALPLMRQAWQVNRKVLGEQHQQTLTSFNAVAAITEKLARAAEARRDFAAARQARLDLLSLRIQRQATQPWLVTDARLALHHLDNQARLTPQQHALLVEAEHLMQKGIGLSNLGKRREGIEPMARALALRDQVLGADHILSANSAQWLGYLVENTGDKAKAETLYRRVLATRLRVLGEDHPDIATTLHNLGVLYNGRGAYREAEPLLRQAVAVRQRTLGDADVNYGYSLLALGITYNNLKEYARAEPLYRQGLEVRKKVLGEKHRDYATTSASLGLLYEKMDNLERAAPLLRQALGIRKEVLGVKDATYIQTVKNLARVDIALAERLVRQDRLTEARTLRTEVLSLQQALYPEGHWQLVDARLALTRVERLSGLAPGARRSIVEMDQQLSSGFGSSDPNQMRKDIELAERALRLYQEHLDVSSADAATVWNFLGVLHARANEHTRAEAALGKAVALRKQVLGENHPDYALSQHNLGMVFSNQQKYSAAEETLRQAVALRKRVLGEKHQDYLLSVQGLIDAYEAQAGQHKTRGDFAAARQVYAKVVALYEEVHGAKDWHVADARASLANCERMQRLDADQRRRLAEADELERKCTDLIHRERFNEALEPAQKALEVRTRLLGNQDRQTIEDLDLVSTAYFLGGQYSKAEPPTLQAAELSKAVLGEDHPSSAFRLGGVAVIYSILGKRKQADPLLQQVSAQLLRLHQQGHTVATNMLGNADEVYELLIRMHEQQDEWAAAKILAQELLKIRIRVHGDKHLRVADARLLLEDIQQREQLGPTEQANVRKARQLGEEVHNLWQKEQYQKALPLARQALELHIQALGDRHPQSILMRFNLAAQLRGLARFAEAETEYRRAGDLWRTVLGADHPHFRMARRTLAEVCAERGEACWQRDELKDAGQAYEQFVSCLTELLGAKHWQVASARQALTEVRQAALLPKEARQQLAEADNWLRQARTLENKGQVRQAVLAAEQAVRLRQQILGADDPSLVPSLFQCAVLASIQGNDVRAAAYLEQTRVFRGKALGTEHPDYASTLSGLGLAYVGLNAYPQAEDLLQQSLQIRQRLLGEEHEDCAYSLNNLGMLYGAQQDCARAEPFLRKALEIRKKGSPEPDLAQAVSLHNLGLLRQDQGDLADAESLYQQAEAVRKKLLGPAHPVYAQSLYHLAKLAALQGKTREAEELYKRAAESQKRALGADSLAYAESLLQLARLYQQAGDANRANSLWRTCWQVARVNQEKATDMSRQLQELLAIRLRPFQVNFRPFARSEAGLEGDRSVASRDVRLMTWELTAVVLVLLGLALRARVCAKKFGKGERDVPSSSDPFRWNPAGSQLRLLESGRQSGASSAGERAPAGHADAGKAMRPTGYGALDRRS